MTDELPDPDSLPDVDRIRAGLLLLAADVPAARPSRSRRPLLAAAAAVAVLAAGAVAYSATRPTSRPVAQPSATPTPSTSSTSGVSIGMPVPPRDLPTMVRDATRVVVGHVTDVTTGTLPAPEGESGDAYVLASVAVDEAIKGVGGTLAAFAYTYGGTTVVTSEGTTRPWQVGDRVLLFLVPDVGTASSDVQPPHMFVDGGESGRYLFDGDQLAAPFTLDDVRRAAR